MGYYRVILWGIFDNEANATYADVKTVISINTVLAAWCLDYVQNIATSANDINLVVWNRGYSNNSTIRFLIQNPKDVADAYIYFAICR